MFNEPKDRSINQQWTLPADRKVDSNANSRIEVDQFLELTVSKNLDFYFWTTWKEQEQLSITRIKNLLTIWSKFWTGMVLICEPR